jgi:hypothetical protein
MNRHTVHYNRPAAGDNLTVETSVKNDGCAFLMLRSGGAPGFRSTHLSEKDVRALRKQLKKILKEKAARP